VQRDLISAQPCAQAQLLINAVLYFNCIESLAHTWATACPKSVPPPPSGSPHSRRCDRGGVDALTSPPAVLAALQADPALGSYRLRFADALRDALVTVLAGLLARSGFD
jgi:hypothetical protein